MNFAASIAPVEMSISAMCWQTSFTISSAVGGSSGSGSGGERSGSASSVSVLRSGFVRVGLVAEEPGDGEGVEGVEREGFDGDPSPLGFVGRLFWVVSLLSDSEG